MSRPLTSGLRTVRRLNPDGSLKRVDYYDRATGAPLGHDRDQAIARVMEGRQKPALPNASTFRGLCTAYKASPEFRRKPASTKAFYTRNIDDLCIIIGDAPVTAITKPFVRHLRDRFVDQPTKGNRIVAVLRLLLSYGMAIGKVKENAASRPGLLEEHPRTAVWTDDQIGRFIAAARPSLARAAALMLYTAQRVSDVLQMPASAVQERRGRLWITLRQEKTDELVEVPLHRRAAELLADVDGKLLVPAPRGGEWTRRNMARAWDDTVRLADYRLARERIATWPRRRDRTPKQTAELKAVLRAEMIAGVQRRDLRRTGMVKMAEAGASPSQIAAVSGHSIDRTMAILDIYIPRRGSIALGAIEAWEENGDRGRVTPVGFRHRVSTPTDTTVITRKPNALKRK